MTLIYIYVHAPLSVKVFTAAVPHQLGVPAEFLIRGERRSKSEHFIPERSLGTCVEDYASREGAEQERFYTNGVPAEIGVFWWGERKPRAL